MAKRQSQAIKLEMPRAYSEHMLSRRVKRLSNIIFVIARFGSSSIYCRFSVLLQLRSVHKEPELEDMELKFG